MRKIQFSFIAIATFVWAGVACAQSPTPSPPQSESKSTPQSASKSPAACQPVETAAANAPGQKPAFAGQTRACAVRSGAAIEVTVLAKGLQSPWAVEPLPDGDFLITEKGGRMRIVNAKGQISEPIAGLQSLRIAASGQGGLLDVALGPDFAKDRTIYWSFSEQREGGSGTSVASGTLSVDRKRLDDVRVIFRAMPTYNDGMHFGSRLAFGPDQKLYITLGERSDKPMRPQAQSTSSHLGKVIRINPDGTAPTDNPFAGQRGALPEIWTLGHRNIQSATFDDKGGFWIVEHGPKGGDELNLVEKGKNYGWPVISYGEEYSGEPIPGNITAREGLEQPVYYWDPVIAPSGMEHYTGSAFPEWRGSIFIGGLISRGLVRLVISDNRVTGEEHLLTNRGRRIRDVRQGPDGALYIVTDESNGELWKIAPGK